MSLFYYPYPSIAPATNEPVIIEVHARIVPLIISSLERYKYQQFWATELDYREGVKQLCLAQEALLTGAQGIVEAIDRVYRLMDTSLNGTEYTAAGLDAADIIPAIPLTPENAVGDAPGLRRQLLDMQGELPDGFMGLFPRPATLADLVKAVRQGSEGEGQNLLDRLDLLGDAGDIAGIFNVVRGTVLQGLEAGAEGGILAVLVASTMANAAMMGLQAGQLDTLIATLNRVVASLDGGAEPRPDSNVLAELAGVNEKLV